MIDYWNVFELSDGTTRLDLVGGAAYAMHPWSPTIAPRRTSDLDPDLYQDVEENPLVLDIVGTSAATCLANLDALIRMLDQSTDWWRDEANTVPITLTARSRGVPATNPARSCLIYVLPGGVVASVPEQEGAACWAIRGVAIRFRRRGLWLGEIDTASTSATETSGRLWTADLGFTHDTWSPYSVSVNLPSVNANTINDWGGAGLILTESGNNLYLHQSNNMSLAFFGWVAVANANAAGGQVGRYTCVSANSFAQLGMGNVPLLNAGPGTWMVFAFVRVAGGAWTLRLVPRGEMGLATGAPNVVGEITIPVSSPRSDGLVTLGTIQVPAAGALHHTDNLLLYVASDTVGATIDINYIVIAKVTPGLSVWRLGATAWDVLYADWPVGAATTLALNHRQATHRAALGTIATPGRSSPVPSPDNALTWQKGRYVNGVFCGGMVVTSIPSGSGYSGPWRPVVQTSPGTTIYPMQFTVMRQRAYLVPE